MAHRLPQPDPVDLVHWSAGIKRAGALGLKPLKPSRVFIGGLLGGITGENVK